MKSRKMQKTAEQPYYGADPICGLHYYAGCTLSPSAFREILEWELLKTRLRECDFLHSCCELSIHLGMPIEKETIKNQRRQPGETRDHLTRTSRTAKNARANEMRHEWLRLYESIRGEASVFIYILTLVLSWVLSASVQPALELTNQNVRHY